MTLKDHFLSVLSTNLVLPEKERHQVADALVDATMQWMNGHKAVPKISCVPLATGGSDHPLGHSYAGQDER